MLPFSTGPGNTAYRVWICDPLDEVRTTGNLPQVVSTLNKWFDPIAKAAKPPFSGAECIFPQYVLQPLPHELLIYVVPVFSSVVKLMPGSEKVNFPNPVSSPHMGVTVTGSPTGSEIWMKNSSADAIASLIFHEAMHNKLQLGNTMHGKYRPSQLSAASILFGSSPSAAESAAMAAALRKPVQQWTDGQGILREARLRRKKGDQYWGNRIGDPP